MGSDPQSLVTYGALALLAFALFRRFAPQRRRDPSPAALPASAAADADLDLTAAFRRMELVTAERRRRQQIEDALLKLVDHPKS